MSAVLRQHSETQLWNALLDEWRGGLERLRGHPPPSGFREPAWRQFKLDAIALLRTHGPRLAALGWTTLQLFGLHDTHPSVRVSHSGLARFLHGGTIVDVTRRHARIRRRSGSVLTFYAVDDQSGAVPAWALHQPEQQGMTEMAEYTMDLDTGAQDQGPWLRFHAQATHDGRHGPGAWSLRDSAGSAEVSLSGGFVFDWPNSRTGWMRATGLAGQAPEKTWNASRTRFERQPGDDWKRVIYVPIAWLADGHQSRAIWEQANASAWMAFRDIMALIRDAALKELPKLPLLCCTGHRPVRLGAGSTLIPQFRLTRYVPRPYCLPETEDDLPAPLPRGNGTIAAPSDDLDDVVPF
jgi:hypothetical protein